MYQVGEFIVHPGQGVCRVEDVSAGPDATYKLLPVGQRHAMHISFPVSNESRLRPILSAEEAREIIDQYPQMDVDDYADRNNSLEEQHFKQEIRNGSCRDTVRVGRNKKAPVAYGRILKLARERSLQELSCALDCTPEDVAALFETSLAGDPSEN